MKITSYLQSFQRFGVNLGLTRIKKLLAALGNPEQKIPLIHVAGTNGKGSVSAYLSSVLTTAGYQVGRYTSPHLIAWTERICLNEQPISETDFLAVLETVKTTITGNFTEEEIPTLFEVVTAAAWLYFAEKKVDVAVMEVGLGGRLDATNIKEESLASVITPISLEHWQVLGDTLTKIATEKAGILKRNCPVFVAPQDSEAVAVIEQRSTMLNCPTTWVKPATRLTEKENWAVFIPPNPPLEGGDKSSISPAVEEGEDGLIPPNSPLEDSPIIPPNPPLKGGDKSSISPAVEEGGDGFIPPNPPLKGGDKSSIPPAVEEGGDRSSISPAVEEGGNQMSYPLPLLGDVQLTNSAVAVAVLLYLQEQGWNLSEGVIQEGMGKTRWLGRLQWVQWRGLSLLLDGAHNPAAAAALRQYVDTLPQPVTWIMGILSTKEQEKILNTLLRSGDTLYTVPVPDHSTTPTLELCKMQTQVEACFPCESLEAALERVISGESSHPTTILCGSLYLVGYFLSSL